MLISCRDIKKSFGDRVILDGIDFQINRRERIGLVGRNGAGKTTLANILAGCIDYEAGSIITARQLINIGYLRQIDSHPEFFLNMFNSEGKIDGEFQRLTKNMGLKRIQDWAGQRLQNLSGGEKTKLALAQIWASQPDLVILDEPTNHMDFQGIEYLISELARFQGAAVIISHDRYFLDQTVSRIAAIENGLIRIYQGNYSQYWETRQKERESQLHAYESQKKEQKEIEIAISRLKGWSDKAHRESRKKGERKMGGKEYFRKKAQKHDRAVKSQIKRLEKMQRDGVSRPPQDLRVNFGMDCQNPGEKRLIQAESIGKSFGRLVLFEDSSFYVNRGEKVGILGPNGCGKTTLIKTILGQENLETGEISVSPSARIAYVSQELPQGETGDFKSLIKDWPLNQQKQTFQLLVNMGVAYDRFSVPMGNLSRGERIKIAIGLAVMGQHDVLVLDEPTNHLDLYSREALEESLLQYPGTILLVSHDRYLLEKVCNQLLIFDNQKIRRIEGNFEYYMNQKHKAPSDGESESLSKDEELLLLDTKISRVLSELSQRKPGEPEYLALDQEYMQLIRQRNILKNK